MMQVKFVISKIVYIGMLWSPSSIFLSLLKLLLNRVWFIFVFNIVICNSMEILKKWCTKTILMISECCWTDFNSQFLYLNFQQFIIKLYAINK